jgi:ethanolamine permease
MIELPAGGGPFLPFGWSGAFAAMPFAVWLYLAIEVRGGHYQALLRRVRAPPAGVIAGGAIRHLRRGSPEGPKPPA